jgi:hypothetical protein
VWEAIFGRHEKIAACPLTFAEGSTSIDSCSVRQMLDRAEPVWVPSKEYRSAAPTVNLPQDGDPDSSGPKVL